MTERAETDDTAIATEGVPRSRTGVAAVLAAPRRALHRVRRRGRPTIGEEPETEVALDGQLAASPTDLAEADVSVQHAWKHLRLVIAIIAALVPVVAALITWRIRLWRAERNGRPVDP